MNSYQIRYRFEHTLLPVRLLRNTGEFVKELKDSENQRALLFRMISGVFASEDVKNPYQEDQFDVTVLLENDELTGIRLGFPLPEKAPLCYCGFLLFDREFQHIAYFTVEKGIDDDSAFLCKWTLQGEHMNYGRVPPEAGADFQRCLKLHAGS